MTVTADARAHAEREKRSAALSSVIAAALLTLLKLGVGLVTGSLGILAEAAHSGLDLVAAMVTLLAVRFSDRPPDTGHPYGHGKVENLSALVETLLLFITCAWIVYESLQRLFFKSVEIEASFWAFAVMATSIIVDITRSRILYAVARKHKSQALEADALHFSTDILSSSVVIAGLSLVWLSKRLGPEWAWLIKADAVAALGVALIVIYVSLQLGRRTVSVLLDAAPPGLLERMTAEAAQVPGVERAGPLRVRQAGASTFADLVIAVERGASLEEAHAIASEVEARLAKLIHQGDVVVHVEPIRPWGESLPDALGAIAARQGLRVHNVHAHEVRGEYWVDLHAEVPPELTLGEAHARISAMEDAIRAELPHVVGVNTHIEPHSIPVGRDEAATEWEAELRARVEAAAESVPGLRGCHDIRIRPVANGYDVTLHCFADPQLPIAEAHRLAERAEQRLRAELPTVAQVLVHVEPQTPEDPA